MINPKWLEAAFLGSADQFRPEREMFVCMDPTGCYHVSWKEEQHLARMAEVGAKHEARYVLSAAHPAGDGLEVVAWGVRMIGQPVFIPLLSKPDAGPEYEVQPLVTLSQANAALSAERARVEELTRERDEALRLAGEDVDALQAIGEEFGIEPGEHRVTGVRRLLTERRAEVKRLREALEKISCPSQTEGLLWWQVEARAALTKEGGNGE